MISCFSCGVGMWAVVVKLLWTVEGYGSGICWRAVCIYIYIYIYIT